MVFLHALTRKSIYFLHAGLVVSVFSFLLYLPRSLERFMIAFYKFLFIILPLFTLRILFSKLAFKILEIFVNYFLTIWVKALWEEPEGALFSSHSSTGLRDPTLSRGYRWPSGRNLINAVINFGWVGLSPRQWPKFGRGPSK